MKKIEIAINKYYIFNLIHHHFQILSTHQSTVYKPNRLCKPHTMRMGHDNM